MLTNHRLWVRSSKAGEHADIRLTDVWGWESGSPIAGRIDLQLLDKTLLAFEGLAATPPQDLLGVAVRRSMKQHEWGAQQPLDHNGPPQTQTSPDSPDKVFWELVRSAAWLVGLSAVFFLVVYFCWIDFLDGYGLRPDGQHNAMITPHDGVIRTDFKSYFNDIGMLTGRRKIGMRDTWEPDGPSPSTLLVVCILATSIWRARRLWRVLRASA